MIAATALTVCTLAVELTNISDRIRQDRAIPDYVAGAIVRMVRINSPAAKAGLRTGDVIMGVDDQIIQNVCGFDRVIAKHLCDDVRLTVRRGMNTMEIVAPLSPPPKPGPHFDDAEACRNNVPAACTALGRRHRQIDLFGLGCDLGDAEGCYLFGVNAGDDNARARNAYRQACDFGNSLACTNLGWMLQFGKAGRSDIEESVRFYQRGCQGSSCAQPNNVGCMNYARMLHDGVGIRADVGEAARIFQQVCDRMALNAEDGREIARGCLLAGEAMIEGDGVVKDEAQGLVLIRKSCAAGDRDACARVNDLAPRSPQPRDDRSH